MLDEASWSFDPLVEGEDFDFVSRHYRTGTPDGLRLVRYSVARQGSFGVHVEPDIHQLTWLDGAELGVFADQEFALVPPTQAMWLPAGTVHDIAAVGPGEMFCVYLRAGIDRPDFQSPRRIEMSDLLRGLLWHLSDDLGEAAGLRARAVLLDCLARVPASGPGLRHPLNPIARAVAERIVTDPGRRWSVEAMAAEAGASARTIRRHFLAETGMTLQEWSRTARLLASLDLLRTEAGVEDIASAVGFASASAFIAAFRQHFGVTPGRYRRTVSTADPAGE